MKRILLVIGFLFILATAGYLIYFKNRTAIPKKAEAVKDFDINRYAGLWYEVARIDFSFQEDLTNCAALYKLNENGTVNVLNSGYNTVKNEWEKAEGTARFRDDKNIAALEVSFFGPFYSGYNVVAIDTNYQYALVAGRNLDYLWILSRTQTLPQEIKNNYLELAQKIGYDTSRLLWNKEIKNDNPFTK